MADDLRFMNVDLAYFELSDTLVELFRKRNEARERFRKYGAENADCRRRDTKSPHDHHAPPQWVVPALAAADRELRELEAKALAEGKPLPDRDGFMAPVRARVAEYERMVPALRKLWDQAEDALAAAVEEELPALAAQAVEGCNKAQKEYRAALGKAEAARARMRASTERFTWAVTAGSRHVPDGRGTISALGDDLDRWEATEDGRITERSAKALGLITPYANFLALDGFVRFDREDAPVPR